MVVEPPVERREVVIEVDRVKERIHLTSPYSPATVASCKRIAGANWSKKARAWTFPLTIETCLRLRQEFGTQLKIRKALSDWYRDETARRQKMNELTSGKAALVVLPRLAKLAPLLHEAVTVARPYQAIAARFIVDGRAVIIADDPGLGKTLETLAGVVESGLPGPYLVVSPKTAATNVWPREIPRWLPGHTVITLPEGRAKRDDVLNELLMAVLDGEDLSKTWVSVHPEAVLTKSYWDCLECGESTPYTRKPKPELDCGHGKPRGAHVRNQHTFPQLFGLIWSVIVADESHEMLVMKSGTPTQRRRGMDLLSLREDGLRLAVSGTPWRSKPQQLWGTLNWLRPKVYTSKWRWIGQYWQLGGYSGYEVEQLFLEREKMLWDELGSVMLRRTKDEVAKDLPAKTYVGTPLDPSDEHSPVGIWLPMQGAQERAYRAMSRDSAARMENGMLEANGVLAELTRLKQLASAYGKFDHHGEFLPNPPSNKMDWVEQFLEDLGIPGEPTGKVVIVSQYTRLLKMLSFGLPAAQGGMGCMLTGDTSGAKRNRVIDAFNQPVGTDSPHIMFLQVKAGGVAITIDSADYMVILDEADPDTMSQVEDRIHRVSNPRPVFYYYLRSEGTIDVGNALVNAQVALQGKRLLDERRGVEFYRKVLELSGG